MIIDSVSTKLIQFALYVDSLKPGTISEIWLEEKLIESIKKTLPVSNTLPLFLETLNKEIDMVSDKRRKTYLFGILRSLKYQYDHIQDDKINLEEFTLNCFGISIPLVDESTIRKQVKTISDFEGRIGKSIQEVLDNGKIEDVEIKNEFLKNLSKAKKMVSSKLSADLPSKEEFSFRTTKGESWSAFNKHTKPFHSELIINLDYPVNIRDVNNLAFHEGYGGHHTELVLKDRLLVDEHRGEHGLVIIYSPQTFMSEAIAVNSQQIFDTQPQTDEVKLISLYDELTGGILLNKVAYMYHQEKKSKKEIKEYLSSFNITQDSKEFILNFTTDAVYGIYTLVYHFAGEFLALKYKQSTKQQELLRDIYTLPTTPEML